jgi:hypothetical protein
MLRSGALAAAQGEIIPDRHLAGGIFSINRGTVYMGFHEALRYIVSARCLISSASEGICLAPLTRSRATMATQKQIEANQRKRPEKHRTDH